MKNIMVFIVLLGLIFGNVGSVEAAAYNAGGNKVVVNATTGGISYGKVDVGGINPTPTPNENADSQSEYESNQKLPQTDEKSTFAIFAMGASMIILGLGLILFSKRRPTLER